MERNKLNVLWVEDSYSDIMLINHALQENNFKHKVHFINDGAEAIDYLYKKGKYSDMCNPDLIILDLNLPKKTGKEVLKEVKSNEDFSHIPVIIFSTSSNKSDISTAYSLNANSYLIKPSTYDELLVQLERLERFWLNTARLPVALD